MHTPRALRVLAVAALSLLISVGTIDPASIASGEGAVTGESCPGNGDVFEFDMPDASLCQGEVFERVGARLNGPCGVEGGGVLALLVGSGK